MDFALNNLQWLICHKTKPNQYCRYSLIQFCHWQHLHLNLYRNIPFNDEITYLSIYMLSHV